MSSSSMPDSHAGKSTVSPNRAWIFSDSDASSMLSISRSVLNFVSAVIGFSRTHSSPMTSAIIAAIAPRISARRASSTAGAGLPITASTRR